MDYLAGWSCQRGDRENFKDVGLSKWKHTGANYQELKTDREGGFIFIFCGIMGCQSLFCDHDKFAISLSYTRGDI